MSVKTPMILKPRRTKMKTLKLNVQFDSNEMEMVDAYLGYQKNVSAFDELAEIGILELIKKDSIFQKMFHSGELKKAQEKSEVEGEIEA